MGTLPQGQWRGEGPGPDPDSHGATLNGPLPLAVGPAIAERIEGLALAL